MRTADQLEEGSSSSRKSSTVTVMVIFLHPKFVITNINVIIIITISVYFPGSGILENVSELVY